MRGLDRHVEDLRDVAALVLHLQRLAVVALAVADLAGHVHVGQEVHLDLHHAVALAGLAAAAGHVEAEAARAVAALARGVGLGHQLADRREQAGVGGGVAARRAADRRLVDVDDLVEVLDALDRLVRGRLLVRAVERARHRGVERVVDQRRLARARDAGHAGQAGPTGKATFTSLRLLPVAPITRISCRSACDGEVRRLARGAPFGGRALRKARGLLASR